MIVAEKKGLSLLMKFVRVMIIVSITAIMIEIVLQVTDPWGVMRSLKISEWQRQTATFHSTGYGIEPGEYIVTGETTTISEQGLRIMPVREDAVCDVVFRGDSFTFSYGISDTETFAWKTFWNLHNIMKRI